MSHVTYGVHRVIFCVLLGRLAKSPTVVFFNFISLHDLLDLWIPSSQSNVSLVSQLEMYRSRILGCCLRLGTPYLRPCLAVHLNVSANS